MQSFGQDMHPLVFQRCQHNMDREGGFQCDLDPDSNPVLSHDCLHNMPRSGHALVGTQPTRVRADRA